MSVIIFSIFLYLSLCGTPTEADLEYASKYGVPIDSADGVYTNMPSYEERWMHHVQNIVRVDQDSYRNFGYCTNGYPANYPGHADAKPTWLHPRLIEVARVQGKDLKDNCGGLQHDSCDGTSAGARVNEYFPCGMSCENGALGYGYYGVCDGWLCEGSTSSCYVGGHTNNIMRSGNSICGIGKYSSYIFQDCSSCSTIFTPETHPIYSGVHYITGEEVKFMAMFKKFGESTEVKAYVAISNNLGLAEKHEMEIEFENDLGSHYIYKLPTQEKICRQYYFIFKFNDQMFYYPETGAILVHNEGEFCVGEGGEPIYFEDSRKMIWGFSSSDSLVPMIKVAVLGLILFVLF